MMVTSCKDQLIINVVVIMLVMICGAMCHAQQCGSQGGRAICGNNLCCSQYGYCGSTSAYCDTGCQSGPCTSVPPVSSIITSDIFNTFLSLRNSTPANGFYTYVGFITAAKAFNGFGTVGGIDVQKRELAAFFANIAHETGSK